MVIRPVLVEVPVLAVAFILNEPVLEPLAGVTVSQDVALLVTVHGLLDDTDTVRSAAPDAGTQVVVLIVKNGAGADCVTFIVRVINEIFI